MNFDIIEIKKGNAKIFGDVFYFYAKKLYNYIYQKTDSEYLSNEVVQLTFIKLWNYRENLNDNVKLSTQIFQIAKTTFIDQVRKREYHKSNLMKMGSDKNLFVKKTATSGYESIDERDTANTLQRAIEKLPPMRKKVFQLSRQQQLSYQEISNELSISVRTVDKHIELALKQIRSVISP